MKEKCDHIYCILGNGGMPVILNNFEMFDEDTDYKCKYCPECGKLLSKRKDMWGKVNGKEKD